MQSSYAEEFQRDMGCTEAEWLKWLPIAVAPCAWTRDGASARVVIGSGALFLNWQVLPPRVIALLRLQRLAVSFVFEGVEEVARQRFMKRFDLTMQRGGG